MHKSIWIEQDIFFFKLIKWVHLQNLDKMVEWHTWKGSFKNDAIHGDSKVSPYDIALETPPLMNNSKKAHIYGCNWNTILTLCVRDRWKAKEEVHKKLLFDFSLLLKVPWLSLNIYAFPWLKNCLIPGPLRKVFSLFPLEIHYLLLNCGQNFLIQRSNNR